MTWTKLGDTDLDEPSFVTLSRGVRLMHVEALVWCNRHGTDGRIPSHALRRLTDEDDVQAAAQQLVGVGRWTVTEAGWEIVDFLKDQLSAADVERVAALTRERQKRQRQHRGGDHSRCDPRYCHAASRVTEPVTDAVSHDTPSRPVPTRAVKAKERDGRTGGAPSESRPPASRQWEFGGVR